MNGHANFACPLFLAAVFVLVLILVLVLVLAVLVLILIVVLILILVLVIHRKFLRILYLRLLPQNYLSPKIMLYPWHGI